MYIVYAHQSLFRFNDTNNERFVPDTFELESFTNRSWNVNTCCLFYISDTSFIAMLSGRYIKIIFAVAFNLVLFSFLGIIALSILWHTKLTPFQDYSLVIDVGSRHTKVFVYT